MIFSKFFSNLTKENSRPLRFANNILKIFLFVYPVYLFFALELLNPGPVSPNVDIWWFHFPNPFIHSPYTEVMKNIPAFVFSVLLIYLLATAVFSFLNSVFASYAVVSLLLYALYFANYYRMTLSGWVLSPADFALAGKVNTIVSFGSININRYVVCSGLIILVGLTAVFFASKRVRLHIKTRIALFGGIIIATTATFFCIPGQRFVLKAIGADYYSMKYSTNKMYRDYGVMLGFYAASQSNRAGRIFSSLNAGDGSNANEPVVIEDPEIDKKYSPEFISDIVEGISRDVSENEKKNTNNPETKPDIIVIMSEAFTDPTLWPNISFSSDPLSELHKLMKTADTGKILTPAFGGSTCNPEYEFLTGNFMYFVEPGQTPFFQNPDKYIPGDDMRALPRILKNNGYKTIGLHPYMADFFNRDKIYPRLGFDEFITDSDMTDAVIKGTYISDEYFTDRIIEQIETNQKQGESPLFLYGISMENHWAYYPGKFREGFDVLCASELLTDYQENCVNSYLQGIYDADKQLGRLIEYLKQSSRPTIVYFFGDHQPILRQTEYDVFESLGYVGSSKLEEWNIDEVFSMHTTPYVMWANYDLPEHNWGNMSPFFIGPLLLDVAGLDKNLYFEYLYQAYSNFHGIVPIPHIYLDAEDHYFTTPLMKSKRVLDNIYYLYYDYIFGDRYSAEGLAKMRE